jgi:hypothetical protein
MIDNKKCFVTGRHRLENHIKNNKLMILHKIKHAYWRSDGTPKKGMDLTMLV